MRAYGSLAAAVLALAAGCATLPPKPVAPRVTLEAVRLTQLSAPDARFTLVLAVDNPNAYDLAVSAFDVKLALDGSPLVAGELAAPVTLVAGASTRVEVAARTSLPAIVTALDRFARAPIVHYEVTGVAVVQDGLALPFRKAGELPSAALPGLPR